MIEVKHHPLVSSDADPGSVEVALSVALAALCQGCQFLILQKDQTLLVQVK